MRRKSDMGSKLFATEKYLVWDVSGDGAVGSDQKLVKEKAVQRQEETDASADQTGVDPHSFCNCYRWTTGGK